MTRQDELVRQAIHAMIERRGFADEWIERRTPQPASVKAKIAAGAVILSFLLAGCWAMVV